MPTSLAKANSIDACVVRSESSARWNKKLTIRYQRNNKNDLVVRLTATSASKGSPRRTLTRNTVARDDDDDDDEDEVDGAATPARAIAMRNSDVLNAVPATRAACSTSSRDHGATRSVNASSGVHSHSSNASRLPHSKSSVSTTASRERSSL